MDDNKTSSLGFPSHLIDSSQKDKEWIARYTKAAWTDFTSYYPNQLYNGRDKYHETKLYMLGKQPVSRYKKLFQPNQVANEDQSWININWDILPIIPKFRRIALSTLLKTDFDISVDAIDPLAQDDRKEFYAQNAARLILKEEYRKQGLDESLVPDPEVDATSLKELDMYMNYSYKHRMAIEMQEALRLILSLNSFEQIREQAIEDLIDYGITGYKEYFDKAGNIKVRHVSAPNMVMSYCIDPNFKDIQYFGEVLELTISDLKALAGNEITDSQYDIIAEKYQNKLGNPSLLKNVNSSENRNYDGFRIRVLDLEFYSVNSLVQEERVNSKGNLVVGRTNKVRANRPDKKYTKTDYKTVYQSMWVIDSDVYFRCELQTNMKRAKSSLTDTTMSYHVVAPQIYQMNTYSLGEQMKTIADQIQMAWYKLQNVMLRARPRGIMIELGALENVPLGRAGKALKPMEIIDLYNQTGNLIYRRLSEDGDKSNYKPIEELDNGIGGEAVQYFNIITSNIQLLRDILGFNEITDGSTPDPRTLKGVAKYATESTNNSLDYIRRSERNLLERLCYSLTLRIQDAAQMGTIDGFVRALGSNSVQFFKLDPLVSAYECGLVITQKPSEAEREKLSRRIEQAIASNQITLADAMMVEALDDIKYAELLLGYKINKNKEDAQRIAMEQQQMNGQIQQQSAAMAAQMQQQTIQLETEAKLAVIREEKSLEAQLLAMKLQGEAALEQMRVEGKIDLGKIESESRQYVAEIKKSAINSSDFKK